MSAPKRISDQTYQGQNVSGQSKSGQRIGGQNVSADKTCSADIMYRRTKGSGETQFFIRQRHLKGLSHEAEME